MRRFALLGATLILIVIALAPCLAAQETQQKAPETAPAEQAKPDMGDPSKATPSVPVTVDPKTFSLGPEDVVFVRVWREPDLTGMLVIRPDGKVTMPLIREVQAAGLTPEQLATNITKQLSEYINNPQVLVQVQAVRSKRYLITGEINRPGAYPLAVPTTVFEAIGLAGGFREFANKKRITIVRGDQRLKFNFNEVVKGKNTAQNVQLESGDKIIVP